MPTRNKRGVLVPNPDEDILQGITTMAANLGVIIPASSIAAARALVTQLEGVSPANPVYFNVDRCLYVHDGATFMPASQTDVAIDYYTAGVSTSLNEGQYSGMAATSLPTRPYARAYVAIGQAWGHAPVGHVDLAIIDGNSAPAGMSLARWSTGTDRESRTAVNMGVIPAGQKPNIAMGVRGGSPSGGTIRLSADPKLQRLMVMAFPAPTV